MSVSKSSHNTFNSNYESKNKKLLFTVILVSIASRIALMDAPCTFINTFGLIRSTLVGANFLFRLGFTHV